jgi:heat shock protein HslJ
MLAPPPITVTKESVRMRLTFRLSTVTLIVVAALAVAGCDLLGGAGGLTGTTWQWTASTTTAPASQSVVPDPENYTIEFIDDGTFSAKVDCNQVGGEYSNPGGGSLTITPGPSTLVACPEGSLADLYLAGLSGTTAYAIADGELTLTTADGTMTFE